MGAHLVGVPQADGAAQGQFPHQQVVHPAEGKLQVSHFVPIQMAVNSLCTTQAQAVRGASGQKNQFHQQRTPQFTLQEENKQGAYKGSRFNVQDPEGSSQPFQFLGTPYPLLTYGGTRHTHGAHSYKVPTHTQKWVIF